MSNSQDNPIDVDEVPKPLTDSEANQDEEMKSANTQDVLNQLDWPLIDPDDLMHDSQFTFDS